MAQVNKDGKWGVINKDGRVITAPQHDEIADLKDKLLDADDNSLAKVRIKDKWALTSAEGKMLFPPEFDEIKLYKGLVRTPQFGRLSHASRTDIAGARLNSKWGLINTEGQWLIQPKFDDIIRPEISGPVLVSDMAKSGTCKNVLIKRFVDPYSSVYRTGFDLNPQEPGFHWENRGGVKTLFNRQGEKIFTIEEPDKTETAKSPEGNKVICPEQTLPLVQGDDFDFSGLAFTF